MLIQNTQISNSFDQKINLNELYPPSKRFIFKEIMNYIFDINEANFHRDYKEKKFSCEINYLMVCFEDSNNLNHPNVRDNPLFNSKNFEDLKSLMNTLTPTTVTENHVKSFFIILNYGNTQQYELLFRTNKVYIIAIEKFFFKSYGLQIHLKNREIQRLIRSEFLQIHLAANMDTKFENFIQSLKKLFNYSLSLIFSHDFFSETEMDLKSLFFALNLAKINLEETPLLTLLSHRITSQNKLSYHFLFNELINAYDSLPKQNIHNFLVPVLSNNSLLNMKLLRIINKNSYFKENFKEIPFNIDVTLLQDLPRNEQINYIKKNSALHLNLIKILKPSNEFSFKLNMIKINYLNNASKGQIIDDKLYPPIINYLIDSNISSEESKLLITYLMEFYCFDIFKDYYSISSSSSFIKKTLQLFDHEELKDFLSLGIYEHGYKYEFGKFINDYELFSEEMKINFLFSSPITIIEDFILNYSSLIILTNDNYKKIFEKAIDLFQNKELPSHIISFIYGWIQAIENKTLLNKLLEEFSLLLMHKFELEGISLIPREILNENLCSKLYQFLKSVNSKIPEISPNQIVNYFVNYNSINSSLNPSYFSLLPTELKLKIGSYLNIETIQSLALSSKEHFQIYGNEFYISKENSSIFKEIFFFLFPEYNWDDDRFAFNHKSIFIKIKIDDHLQKNIDILFLKLNSNNNLDINDQKLFLSVLQSLFSNGLFNDIIEKRNNIDIASLSSYSDIKNALFDLIDYVFNETKNIFNEPFINFLIFLNKINIKLPCKVQDKIIENYHHSVSTVFHILYKNMSLSEIENEIKKNKFFSITFLENLINRKLVSNELIFQVFISITNKHLDIDYIRRLLNNSKDYFHMLFLADFPEDLQWRLNYIEKISESISFSLNTYEKILKFLSFNSQSWTNHHIKFLIDLNPLFFMSICLRTKFGLSMQTLSQEENHALIIKTAQKFGYSNELHNFINKSHLNIIDETIFNFGIHNNTNFTDFIKRFKRIQQHRPLHVSFQNIKDIVMIFCNNISDENTRYDVSLNFFTDILQLNDEQNVELFILILNILKLRSLTILKKTDLFNHCMRINDNKITSIIEKILHDKDECKYFIKNYKIIEQLIGKDNASILKNQINKKRENPYTNQNLILKKRRVL